MEETKPNYIELFCLSILVVLAVFVAFVDVYGNYKYYSGIMAVLMLGSSVPNYILCWYYVIIGYKKSKDLLIKTIFWLYALRSSIGVIATLLVNSASIIESAAFTNIAMILLRIICIGIIIRVTLKLDDIQSNFHLLAIAALLIFILTLLYFQNYQTSILSEALTIFWNFGVLFQFLDIMFAYIFRFRSKSSKIRKENNEQ